jgi:hypothetical protein
MRRLVLVAALVVSGCGASPPVRTHALDGASARTTARGSARFTLSIAATVAGVAVQTAERGTVSFVRPQAHFYRLVSSGGLPQESIVDGPFTYTNGNVQLALSNPSVRPWTKLDTRRLPARQRRNRLDELAHVRVLAYLADGVVSSVRVGSDGPRTHLRGRVEPRRLLARVPARERETVRAVLHAEYVDRPFAADFWLDDANRVRRVHVSYRTARGGRVTIDGGFSDFGVRVDVTPPPAREVQDITP